MAKTKVYFEIKIEALRILGGWAADCAERVLYIYEDFRRDDARPRDAINGIRVFAEGGKRTAKLRVLALDAYRASLEAENPAASAAARASSLAAASAYTHPLADVTQTGHIVGPAAYSAFAIEIQNGNNPILGNEEVRWAIEHAQVEVCYLLLKMPKRTGGKSRIEKLMFDVDAGLRTKVFC